MIRGGKGMRLRKAIRKAKLCNLHDKTARLRTLRFVSHDNRFGTHVALDQSYEKSDHGKLGQGRHALS